MTTEQKYDNALVFFEPDKSVLRFITAFAFMVLGLTVGWGYAFAFAGGAAVWSFRV